MSRDTILVIGATGKTGRHVVSGLLDNGVVVRALVRHPLTAGLPDDVTMIEGSLEDQAAVAKAADGADAAFLIWPSFDSSGAEAVVSTLAAHVDHVVYLSAAQLTGDDDGVQDGVYADVEGLVQRSGVTWTFVRAGGFAANSLEWAAQIRAGDTVAMPYPEAARSVIDERDIADVAVRALLDPALAGTAIAVTGPQALTLREQVETIGEAIGRELTVAVQDRDDAQQAYTELMGEDFAALALDYWASLAEMPERATDCVESVTGRPARSFAQWAQANAHEFRRLSTREVAIEYADGFRTGQVERSTRLLAPDVVRVAPMEDADGGMGEVRGIRAITENAHRQMAGVTMIGVEVSEPLIGGDRFALRFVFHETVEATGEPRTTVKVSLCTVAGSRIVREEVFYHQGGPTISSRD